MPKVPEYVINVKLADILNRELGIDARAERIKGRRRPDIRCYYKGLIIGIEASYSKSDAEEDAARRIEQGLVDIALALWFKKPYRDVSEQQLYEAIRSSRFDVKIFVPKEVAGTLIPFIEKHIKKKAEPVTGWFIDIDLPMLKTIIENSVGFLIREEEVAKLLLEVKEKIDDFIKALIALDSKGVIRGKIYDILYKLYGLSVAEAEEPEIAFGHAALSILLSSTFYEHIRTKHPELKSLSEYVRKYGSLEGLRKALEDLLKIDYKTAIEASLSIINVLPPNIGYRIKDLMKLGIKLASNSSLLRKDFAGRIYHEISGDLALRKGFATFYTEVPAAYLLASLAALSLLGLDRKDVLELNSEEAHRVINKIKTIKVGDLACGSGTLLTASYSALMRIATMIKYYHNLEDADLDEIGKVLIEEDIYGIDALRYASQITAINLALIGPSTIAKENVYTIYLGYIPEKNQAWLGSLELLNNVGKVGGLLAYIEGGLRGVVEKTTLEGAEGVFSIPSEFNLVIMNPPFTRPTYRGKKRISEEKRAFFGFITDKKIRERLVKRYQEILRRITNELREIATESIDQELRDLPSEIKELIKGVKNEKLRQYLNIGLAGEALPFLYLAHKCVGEDGIIAFVLPRAVLAGVSWFLARVLLASKFHLKYVIVSSDPKNGYNFSEGAALSEVLLVAKKVRNHDPSEETVFAILTKKPRAALEGVLTAEEIVKASKRGEICFSRDNIEFIISKVRRKTLLKYIDNWNRFVAIPEPLLSNYTFKLLDEGLIIVGKYGIKIPLARLEEILKITQVIRKRGKKIINVPVKSIGIDAHQFYELYKELSFSPYPAFIGTEERFRKSMKVKPNAYIVPKKEDVKVKAINTFEAYAGKVLVPGVNIRWNTSHVIVLYSEQDLLSNTHYAIKLNVAPDIEPYAEKALVLWFNTTWGILSILINREETEGPWAQIKMGQWMLMPVLDVTSLDNDTLRKLAEVFDKYADKPLRRIPRQFNPNNPDPVRLGIDKEFVKALAPSLDNKIVERELRELYKHVHTALELWIRE